MYHLIHRDDTKNCPQKVIRRKFYKILFTNADIILIKTKGKREIPGPKPGREKCHATNVYLHYLQSFLKDYDVKFRSESVVVL